MRKQNESTMSVDCLNLNDFQLIQEQLLQLTCRAPNICKEETSDSTQGSHLEFRCDTEIEVAKLEVFLFFLGINTQKFGSRLLVFSGQFQNIQFFFTRDNQLNLKKLRNLFCWLDPEIGLMQKDLAKAKFNIALNQLHLLTSIAPIIDIGTVRIESKMNIKERHLRFILNSESERILLSQTLTELRISHTNNLAKKEQYLITIDSNQLEEINRIFFEEFAWLKSMFPKISGIPAKTYIPYCTTKKDHSLAEAEIVPKTNLNKFH